METHTYDFITVSAKMSVECFLMGAQEFAFISRKFRSNNREKTSELLRHKTGLFYFRIIHHRHRCNNNNNNNNNKITKLGGIGAVVTSKICTVQNQTGLGLLLQLLFVNFPILSSKTPGWYLVTDHKILLS